MAPARGFTLVELLAGVAVGLLVLAAGSALLVHAATEGRRTVAETRLVQDLRHAAEQIARNLRRAGHWGAAVDAVGAGDSRPNPYAALDAGAGTIAWRWSRDTSEDGLVGANEQFGLRLRQGVVQMQLGSAGWQAMTDAATVRVTTLALEPQLVETPLPALCDAPCAEGDTSCPPRHVERRVAIAIAGHPPGAPARVKRFATELRLRNDLVVGRCSP